jgi:hypothetical protein
MFSTHQKAIADFALSSNVGLERTFRLVFLSIRQPFHSMAKQMRDVDDNGLQSPYLFGWKRDGLAFVRANASTIRETLKAVPAGYGDAQALLEVATVPGLGLVKAGFVLQLVTGSAGCIDSHNLQRFGLNANAFKYGSNASDALKRKKALAYLDACWKAGGCASLWNGWCDYVAAQQPKHWQSGFDVSAMHESAILGDY